MYRIAAAPQAALAGKESRSGILSLDGAVVLGVGVGYLAVVLSNAGTSFNGVLGSVSWSCLHGQTCSSGRVAAPAEEALPDDCDRCCSIVSWYSTCHYFPLACSCWRLWPMCLVMTELSSRLRTQLQAQTSDLLLLLAKLMTS